MNYLRDGWRKTFCYTGRTSRKQYWITVLWQIVSVFIFGLVTILLRMPMGLPFFVQEVVLGWLFYLLVIILTLYVMASFFMFLALIVRRIHDIGLSGWWVLIGLVPVLGGIAIFVFTVIEGNTGDNKYGPDPIKPIVISDLGTPVAGSVALAVVLVVVIILIVAGGIWYYEVHSKQTSQSASESSFSNNPTAPTSTTLAVVTSTPSAQSSSQPAIQPTNVPVVSQPSVAVPIGWNQEKFLYSEPISGCVAFNYPPAFSKSGSGSYSKIGSYSETDSYYDQNGDTFKFWINQGGFTQQMDEYAAEAGYSEKNFTTTSGLVGKEYVLKNNPTQFYIATTVGSQQVLVTLDFDHESDMPPSSLDLSTEEAIARSVALPCPSQ